MNVADLIDALHATGTAPDLRLIEIASVNGPIAIVGVRVEHGRAYLMLAEEVAAVEVEPIKSPPLKGGVH